MQNVPGGQTPYDSQNRTQFGTIELLIVPSTRGEKSCIVPSGNGIEPVYRILHLAFTCSVRSLTHAFWHTLRMVPRTPPLARNQRRLSASSWSCRHRARRWWSSSRTGRCLERGRSPLSSCRSTISSRYVELCVLFIEMRRMFGGLFFLGGGGGGIQPSADNKRLEERAQTPRGGVGVRKP